MIDHICKACDTEHEQVMKMSKHLFGLMLKLSTQVEKGTITEKQAQMQMEKASIKMVKSADHVAYLKCQIRECQEKTEKTLMKTLQKQAKGKSKELQTHAKKYLTIFQKEGFTIKTLSQYHIDSIKNKSLY